MWVFLVDLDWVFLCFLDLDICFFLQVRNFSVIISSNMISSPFFSFGTLIMLMLVCLMLSQGSLKLFTFKKILLFAVLIGWFPLPCLPDHWFHSSASSNLLIPSSAFFILVIVFFSSDWFFFIFPIVLYLCWISHWVRTGTLWLLFCSVGQMLSHG